MNREANLQPKSTDRVPSHSQDHCPAARPREAAGTSSKHPAVLAAEFAYSHPYERLAYADHPGPWPYKFDTEKSHCQIFFVLEPSAAQVEETVQKLREAGFALVSVNAFPGSGAYSVTVRKEVS